MKYLSFLLLLIPSLLCADTYKTLLNPYTGKFDYVNATVSTNNVTGLADTFANKNDVLNSTTTLRNDLTTETTTRIYNDGLIGSATGYLASRDYVYQSSSNVLTGLNTFQNASNQIKISTDSIQYTTLSREANTFTLKNSVNQPGFAYALNFSGASNSYVTIPNGNYNDFAGDFSIECWIAPTTTNGEHEVLSMAETGISSGTILYVNANKMTFFVATNNNGVLSWNQIVQNSNISTTDWTHFICQRASNIIKMYVNGVLQSATATVNGTVTVQAQTTIGIARTLSASTVFYGKIDEINIWNRALSQAEATAKYNNGVGVSGGAETIGWHLSENTGTQTFSYQTLYATGTFASSNVTWATGKIFDSSTVVEATILQSANGVLQSEAGQTTIGQSQTPLILNGQYIALQSTGTERMRIIGSGNIGIGTTNPTSLLDVEGNLNANTLTVDAGQIAFTASTQTFSALNTFNNKTTFLNNVVIGSTVIASNFDVYYNSPSSTPALIPTMTNYTVPSGTASASTEFNATYPAWKAFDGKNAVQTDSWLSKSATAQWLLYQFPTAQQIGRVDITSRNDGVAPRSPRSWTIQGSTSGTGGFNTLYSTANVTDWTLTSNVTKSCLFTNTTYYEFWRINITSGCANDYIGIGECQMYQYISVLPALSVSSNGAVGVQNISPQGMFQVGFSTFIITKNGNVGIGITNPSCYLDVNGCANISQTLRVSTAAARQEYGVMIGTTTRLYNDGLYWDDVWVTLDPASSLYAPTYTTWKGGRVITLSDEAVNPDQVPFKQQLPHWRKIGSQFDIHVHWTGEDGTPGAVAWKVDYATAPLMGVWGVATTSTTYALNSGTTDYHNITSLKTVIPGNDLDISAFIQGTVSRDTTNPLDTYEGKNIYLLGIDMHCQGDSLGSDGITSKR